MRKATVISLSVIAGVITGVMVWEIGPGRVLASLLSMGLPAPLFKRPPTIVEEELQPLTGQSWQEAGQEIAAGDIVQYTELGPELANA